MYDTGNVYNSYPVSRLIGNNVWDIFIRGYHLFTLPLFLSTHPRIQNRHVLLSPIGNTLSLVK